MDHHNGTVLEIRIIIDRIVAIGVQVAFAWIPGHTGIPGNEVADRLARTAAETEIIPNPLTSITKGETKAIMRQHCMEAWEEQYKRDNKGLNYKKYQPSVMENLPSYSNRLTSSTMFRLQTGHCRLNKHLYKIGVKDSPNCDYCHIPETVEHFLMLCSEFNDQRSFLINSAHRASIPFTLNALLTEAEIAPHLIKFIRSCGKQV